MSPRTCVGNIQGSFWSNFLEVPHISFLARAILWFCSWNETRECIHDVSSEENVYECKLISFSINILLLVMMQSPQILERLPNDHVSRFWGDFLFRVCKLIPTRLPKSFCHSTAINLYGWLACITGFQEKDRAQLYLHYSASLHLY